MREFKSLLGVILATALCVSYVGAQASRMQAVPTRSLCAAGLGPASQRKAAIAELPASRLRSTMSAREFTSNPAIRLSRNFQMAPSRMKW